MKRLLIAVIAAAVIGVALRVIAWNQLEQTTSACREELRAKRPFEGASPPPDLLLERVVELATCVEQRKGRLERLFF